MGQAGVHVRREADPFTSSHRRQFSGLSYPVTHFLGIRSDSTETSVKQENQAQCPTAIILWPGFTHANTSVWSHGLVPSQPLATLPAIGRFHFLQH